MKMVRGTVFDSSSGIYPTQCATRSPDAAWIRQERWNWSGRGGRRASFAPICPDFVVELKSSSDTLSSLKAKMEEYIANGALLGVFN